MKKLNWISTAAVLLAALAFLTSVASAQSTITGQVTDTSGAVMPGVTVVAASEALIEKQRTVSTDEQGRYAIVDLRPGTYAVTFTKDGFATVKQSTEVPDRTTVTIDGHMKVGAVGETVNVEAAAPTVDLQNAAHPEVMTRDLLDAIPNSHNMQEIGSLVPGVHLNTPDVGGSMLVQQTYMTTHGMDAWSDTILFDGILINQMQTDGEQQDYMDNESIQEATYQNSNIGVEIQAGGTLVSNIPKDGGNEFHGEIYLGGTPSAFDGHNVTAAETARGLTGQSRVVEIEDFDGSFGGPIKKDKLWFLMTGRRTQANLQSPGSFYLNGQPGVEYDHVFYGQMRLTYQATPKIKLSVVDQRMWKYINDDIVTGAGSNNDTNPNVSSDIRKPRMYYIAQVHFTDTQTSKLILSGGFGASVANYTVLNQPGVFQLPGSPAAIAGAEEVDTALLRRSVSDGANNWYYNERYAYNVMGEYITGSHQFKFGYEDSFGRYYQNEYFNGDAIYNYQNGVPFNITAEDTPLSVKDYLDHDLGLFGSDTWKFKRLSITAGLRWEYLENHVNPESAPAGRFVPARSFAEINCSTIKGISCFKDWIPRIGAVYDLFGNHKTALKAGFGKYNIPIVESNLNAFNPMTPASETVSWVGAPTTACQVPAGMTAGQLVTGTPGCYPLGNGFGQGNIGPNPNLAFGVLPNQTLDPNYHRWYVFQYSAGVQRELFNGATLNFNWNRVSNYQPTEVVNEAVPASAWTPQTITNPLNGQPITIFNLSSSYAGLTPVLHETNAPQSLRRNVYNGFETSFVGRLRHGIVLNAGWSLDHMVDRTCDQPTNSNNLNDPNSLRYCDMTGASNLTVNGINVQSLGALTGVPYRNEFKVTGVIPIKWGIQAGLALYSAPVSSTNYTTNLGTFEGLTRAPAVFSGAVQGFKTVNWSVSSTTRYPTDCDCSTAGQLVDPNLHQGTEVIQLVAPGSQFTPRLAQLDLSIRRVFRFKERYSISAEFSAYNTLNQSIALAESQSLGTNNAHLFMNSTECAAIGNPASCGIGGAIATLTNPRMFRIATIIRF